MYKCRQQSQAQAFMTVIRQTKMHYMTFYWTDYYVLLWTF